MNSSRRIPCRRLSASVLCLLLAGVWGRAQVAVKIGQNFTGSTYGIQSAALPADPNGAVGPRHFVEFINGTFAVYNRTNGQSVQRKSDIKFWSDAGLIISPDSGVSDPRIIYDPISQRWFASEVDYDAAAPSGDPTLEANDFLLAVSATSDPAGSWKGFMFQADPDNGYFADFPTLGLDADGVFLAGDFYFGSDNPVGPGLVSVPKADLLASTPAITNRTWFGVMDYSVRGQVLQPAICLDGSSGGNILAMGDIGTDSYPHSNLVSFVVQNAAGPAATLTASTSITVNPYVVPENPDLGLPLFTAVQPDGTATLQANDARFSAKVYGVGGVLHAVHSTELNGRIAIRWYRIQAATHTLLESGTLADASLDLYFPSIAANTNGTVVIGYNASGSGTYIGCYAIAGLTVNGVTTFGDPILLQSGAASYHDLYEELELATQSRWGDYSALSIDPTDASRFWFIGMYASGTEPTFGTGIWSTRITQLLTAPLRLAISPSGTNVMVSWPVLASDYQLLSTTNLASPAAWSNTSQPVQTNSTLAFVLAPISGRQQFFRLYHP
jgi:hypothetical protein